MIQKVSRYRFVVSMVAACFMLPVVCVAGVKADDILLLNKPAANWEKEAFPLGNGRLGCMVFGGVEEPVYAGDEADAITLVRPGLAVAVEIPAIDLQLGGIRPIVQAQDLPAPAHLSVQMPVRLGLYRSPRRCLRRRRGQALGYPAGTAAQYQTEQHQHRVTADEQPTHVLPPASVSGAIAPKFPQGHRPCAGQRG